MAQGVSIAVLLILFVLETRINILASSFIVGKYNIFSIFHMVRILISTVVYLQVI